MSYYAEETYDVYQERRIRARKVRPCSACQEPIAPGHHYVRVTVIFEGTVDNHSRCIRCQVLHEHLRTLGDGEMWPDEQLNCGRAYENEWGKEPPPEIAALAFMTADERQALPTEAPMLTRQNKDSAEP